MDVRIAGTGWYAPGRIETAAALAPQIGRSEEWITKRTGVVRRRVSDLPMAEMAAEAARRAIGDGPPPDLILNTSLTPIQLIPDSSVFIQQQLGLEGIPSFSLHATCLSFLVGLQTAGALLQTRTYDRILLVSAEQGSVCRDFTEPESAALIGDGAAAALLERTPPGGASALLGHAMRTYPQGAAYTELRGCGTRRHPNDPQTVASDNLFQMNGPRIYRLAYSHADEVLDEAFAQAGLSRADVALVVHHQATGPMLAAIPRFGFPEHKIVDLIGTYGNCIAASIPMALAHAHESGRLSRGDVVLLFGTGAGLSLAATLLRF